MRDRETSGSEDSPARDCDTDAFTIPLVPFKKQRERGKAAETTQTRKNKVKPPLPPSPPSPPPSHLPPTPSPLAQIRFAPLPSPPPPPSPPRSALPKSSSSSNVCLGSRGSYTERACANQSPTSDYPRAFATASRSTVLRTTNARNLLTFRCIFLTAMHVIFDVEGFTTRSMQYRYTVDSASTDDSENNTSQSKW